MSTFPSVQDGSAPAAKFGLRSQLLDPIRAEPSAATELEQQARDLALAHGDVRRGRGRHLTPRVVENGRVLLACFREIAQAIREERWITPAAEWLVDNFYIVDEQLREIREDLPSGYYRSLPKLTQTELAGFPRVYGVAWTYVALTDSRFDPDTLRRFVRAYQDVAPLTIGELWAVAITLRVVLVENLRRLAERVVLEREARTAADRVADEVLGLAERPGDPEEAFRALERSPLPSAFAVRLIQRLREHEAGLLILARLEEQLSARGPSSEQTVRLEHQEQAAMNVTVRNVITSMRLTSAFEWAEFFESVSLVDQRLRTAGAFAQMDFASRDHYRHAIENLARVGRRSELDVVDAAIAAATSTPPASMRGEARATGAARRGAAAPPPTRDRASSQLEPGPQPSSPESRSEPGWYLVGGGAPVLERALGLTAPPWRVFGPLLRRYATTTYLGSVALATALALLPPVGSTLERGVSLATVVALALVGLVPASVLAIAIVNRFVTQVLAPVRIMKLDLRDGLPDSHRALVAVQTLLTDASEVREQIERLEVHYLSNPEPGLSFALLTDWADADAETVSGDESLLRAATEGIEALNRRHGPGADGEPRFFLLHRRRTWNAGEKCWMGWERKRGKIHELNQLLRGAPDTTFLALGGQPPHPPRNVRYVITLDADTRLPRGAATRLIGAMAHPLNLPVIDPVRERVVEGHAVMQPRVTTSLPNDRVETLFHLVYSGPAGTDPYAFAISDVYQDLFDEGTYTGKGVYDVDAFQAVLADRVPENMMLSHDLFEGSLARTALVTDVLVFEDFPSHYGAAAARLHRWARGDWQLLPWIIGRAPRGPGGARTGRLPAIARWKMIDNLRRTLVAPLSVLTLALAWTIGGAAAGAWTGFVFATIALPPLLSVLRDVVPDRHGVSLRSHFGGMGRDVAIAVVQIASDLMLLAHQSWLMGDAVVRTLVRLATRRRRLEWVTAAQVGRSAELGMGAFLATMGAAPVIAVASAIAMIASGSRAWPAAAPFLLGWTLSPLIARWGSLPTPVDAGEPLSPARTRLLRLTARRTWRFFEAFATAEHNHLPPDNFQEVPHPIVASRTSPTNVGMALLSTVTARDFGWIDTGRMVERLEGTLDTLRRLERYRGHFYNWYATDDLRPLDPRYVSTVDSGNLAGNLLALAQACREYRLHPPLGTVTLEGLGDTLALARQALGGLEHVPTAGTVTREQLRDQLERTEALLTPAPRRPQDWLVRLAALEDHTAGLLDMVATLHEPDRKDDPYSEAIVWARAAYEAASSHRVLAESLMPWAVVLAGHAPAEDAGRDGHAADPLRAMAQAWDSIPTPADAPARCETAAAALRPFGDGGPHDGRVAAAAAAFAASAEAWRTLDRRLLALAHRAEELFDATDFTFLFDSTRRLFTIGYRVTEHACDAGFYDLLASESNLASLIAIAKNDVPASHWFRLGRGLTPVEHGSALLSWSGSMFEYLMPSLVLRLPSRSLLEQTSRLVVRRQMHYGADRGVPWGVSESAYNERDVSMTYQYSAFGIPGLGLKRGLGQDLVIAPYATALAAMVAPDAAVANLERLARHGAVGPYGYYESIDYTRSRLPENTRSEVVRAFMAHHQGMTLVALGNVLHQGRMRERFHADPRVQAIELLLQERTPRDVMVARPRTEVQTALHVRDVIPAVDRRFQSPHGPAPHAHLLSNGRYVVMVTAAGAGYSHWHDLAITRWSGDTTRDPLGSFIYLRDADTEEVWSAGYQPTGLEPGRYEAVFSEERVEIVREDGPIATKLEVLVSAVDDAEVRRVTISNRGTRNREIELTSYAEIVMAPPAADASHPAFSNLFVRTEWEPSIGALLATRRRRSANDPSVWVAHVVSVEGDPVGALQFETDRARFLGRGRGHRTPLAIVEGRPLSNTVGSVLDPVLCLRPRVRIPAGDAARVTFATVVADTREAVLALAARHRDHDAFDRVATMAWTQAQVQLHHLGIAPEEAHLFQRLASRLLYPSTPLRGPAEALRRNQRGASGLWHHGISGDLPIVLLRIDESGELELVAQLLRAQEYWQLKRLAVDLVILNENPPSYLQDFQTSIDALVRASRVRSPVEREGQFGRVFVLPNDRIDADDRDLLLAAARVVLSGHGTLTEQIVRPPRGPEPPGILRRRVSPFEPPPMRPPARPALEFFNGLGGFAADGREYVITLAKGQWTPAPWVNVIANPDFGFVVSECGSGVTWCGNSRENRLTPWSNDPVSDPPGEVLYVRDDESGDMWGPTALPIREEATPYLIRHRFGSTRFEHASHGIALELLQFVPLADPIKISRLRVTNRSGRTRRLSVAAYVEWVLGVLRTASAPTIVTEHDAESGALFARNAWNPEFGRRVAFADLGGRQDAWTCDRTEFVGRNGTLDRPAGLERGAVLQRRSGPALDPCAALRASFAVRDGETLELRFLLGQGESREQARALIARWRQADLEASLAEVERHWDDVTGALQVRTPDRSFDLVINGWALYQTITCRIWARTAFYQSSGAYGFRDQLQDVMALIVARRELAREHLLRAAARQFPEGDVEHWWHPPSNRGVRTRIADDRVWLPWAVIHYVEVTQDRAVLDEVVPFVSGPPLEPGHDDLYFEPGPPAGEASLYEHCARALDSSLATGAHGLPLMGSGDWNDGMNRVGHEGRGESVWLGWFLHIALWEFARIADERGDDGRARRWRDHVRGLEQALEAEGWDGDWYRRAFFDDGTPLGSSVNLECRIDSIAQSWAVLSGAADAARASRAMANAEEYLVRRGDGLVLLFTPPFDKTEQDPGYIKGYVPGVRENGGQYTHAAIWVVLAFAALGDGDKAGELFALINPVNHASTRAGVHRYKVEPYVVAADVYAEPPHVGRGGWTWYTGSSGWMYRGGVEWILGFRLRGDRLFVDPCIPRAWRGFELRFRYHSARYKITVENPRAVARGVVAITLDGRAIAQPPGWPPNVMLADDGGEHVIVATLG